MKKHWKRLLWAGVCLLCLGGFFLLRHGDKALTAPLTPQFSAERWETAEKPYAMASVFLTGEEAVPASRMDEVCIAAEKALAAGGVGDWSWYYAASCQRDGVLRNGGASCKAELTVVGGDFFQAHPLPLRSGSYFREDDLMHDRIVLSRAAAWDLFYSDNVAGQLVELDGALCQVAAVVDTEPGSFNETAAGDARRAWVLHDCPALGEAEPGYTCIEMVLPQPVKNFAASTLKSALSGMIPEDTPVTDNSARFSLKNRWAVLRSLSTRSLSGPADYPYWEQAARLAENRLALRLVPEAILLAAPLISLVILLLWLNHRRTWGLWTLREAAENAIDRKYQRDYARLTEQLRREKGE